MLCSVNTFTQPRELGEYRLGRRGPLERLWMLVVVIDERVDLALEVGHRLERTAADRLVGDQGEPALDLIEPGTVGWREMDVKAGSSRQPGTNPRRLPGGG